MLRLIEHIKAAILHILICVLGINKESQTQ
jgi:hypothetical protein